MKIVEIKNSKINEKYFVFTHKSGLRVYVYPKNMSSSYTLFATKYGSLENVFKLADDAEFTTVPAGIAHFLEHKMFENEDGIDTFERFGKTGASANAFTSFDRTAYLFSSTENFYPSLEILLDFVTHPYFTKETVAKEQGIIAQEIQMYEDRPESRVYYELMRALYKKHDVRIEIAGSVDSIQNITADLLYKCYRTFYNLHNMALCVCGDVEPDKVCAVLDRVLQDAPLQEVVCKYAAEDATVNLPYAEIHMEVSKPLFAIGVKDTDIPKDPRAFLKKDYGMQILNEMLFSSSTDFYCDLYEKGVLNNKFSAEYDTSPSFAYQYYSGETDDPQSFFETFKTYIKQMQKGHLDKDAFLRAKRVVYAEFVRLFDSTEDIANALISNVFAGTELLENVDIIDSIDLDFVESLLRDAFKEEYYALSVVLPTQEDDDV